MNKDNAFNKADQLQEDTLIKVGEENLDPVSGGFSYDSGYKYNIDSRVTMKGHSELGVGTIADRMHDLNNDVNFYMVKFRIGLRQLNEDELNPA